LPTVSGIIEAVKEGELALPEFQRDYRWPAAYIEELLRSLARGWPIGTFLFLDQSDNPRGLALEARAIEDAPPCKKRPENLILDGQQRVTALFHALTGEGDYVFYIDLNKLLQAGEFVDECLDSVREKQLQSKLGKPEKRRQDRIILLRELYSTELFFEWIGFLPEADRKKYAALRDDHLAKFREHTVRVEKISNGLPVEAISKIFERTNRGFLKLDAFDLMVAIMYPHRFKLRDRWDAAKSEHPILERFKVAPIEILRLIALREHLRQKKAGTSPQTVKGVRQSDVLEVKPAVVKREWAKAARAYARALGIAESSFGMIRERVVPSEAQVLPLADAVYEKAIRAGSAAHKRLDRWFWAAIFSRQYARAANTRAVSDAEMLRSWIKTGRSEPRYIKEFKISPDDFSLVEDGNEAIVKGLCCLLNTQGARSWSKAEAGKLPPLVADVDSDLAIHHVFPKKFMSRKTRQALRNLPPVDAPANQVLIAATLNSKLLNEAPEHAVKNPEVDQRGVETHLVDPARMDGKKYKQFVSARAAVLVPLVDRAVKGY
jgi:hypothetical protein